MPAQFYRAIAEVAQQYVQPQEKLFPRDQCNYNSDDKSDLFWETLEQPGDKLNFDLEVEIFSLEYFWLRAFK